MANHDVKQAMTVLLDAWLPEFKQSVEMFTGQSIGMERAADTASGIRIGSEGSVLWEGQTLQREQGGVFWVGAPSDTWAALTQALGEDAANSESLYREMLEQSFDTATQALNSEGRPKLVRGPVVKGTAWPSDLAATETVWIAMPGKERIAILVGIESALANLLKEQPAAETSSESQKPGVRSPEPLERLTDLELPVAVVLGRAKVRIGDAIKLTAGSLIELDSHVDELVEIIVHNVVVARGEVVSVKGNYGVRVREVISPGQRYALQASSRSRSSLANLQPAADSRVTEALTV